MNSVYKSKFTGEEIDSRLEKVNGIDKIPFEEGSGENSAQNKRGVATGVGATAIGANAIASGDYSFAEGSEGIECTFKAVEDMAGQYKCTNSVISFLLKFVNKLYRVPPAQATPDDIVKITFLSDGIVQSDRNLTKDIWYIYPEAAGKNSHQEGTGHAIGEKSHVEGTLTIALASYAHAEGNRTIAGRSISHAEGAFTKAYGMASHAEGFSTDAIGNFSHSEGKGTETHYDAEHAEGKYNKSNPTTQHSVGIGTSDTDRKNAFEIMQNGDAYLYGLGGYDGKNPDKAKSIQEVVASAGAGGGTFLGVLKPDDPAPQSTEGGFYISTEKGRYFNGFHLNNNNFMLIWINRDSGWWCTKIRINPKPKPQMVLWRHLPLISDGSCWYFIKTDLGIRTNAQNRNTTAPWAGNLFMDKKRLSEIAEDDYSTAVGLFEFIANISNMGVFVRGPWNFSHLAEKDAATDDEVAHEILERLSRHWRYSDDTRLSSIECKSTKVMFDFANRKAKNIEKVKYDPNTGMFKNERYLVCARWVKHLKSNFPKDNNEKSYYTKFQRMIGVGVSRQSGAAMNLVWYSRKKGKISKSRWGKTQNSCLSGGDGPKSLYVQTLFYFTDSPIGHLIE